MSRQTTVTVPATLPNAYEARGRQPGVYDLVAATTRAEALPSIYEAALDAIRACLDADRGSILFADADGVMRFKAWRNLSVGYREAVEGHTPWQLDDPDPQPVCVNDTGEAAVSEHLREVIEQIGRASCRERV